MCQTSRGEEVPSAAGRRPNSDGLGLAERGISLAHSGGIIVDDYLETTAPGVYAAGDVTGRDQFVYMAAYGAKLAAAFGKQFVVIAVDTRKVAGKNYGHQIGRGSWRERVCKYV